MVKLGVLFLFPCPNKGRFPAELCRSTGRPRKGRSTSASARFSAHQPLARIARRLSVFRPVRLPSCPSPRSPRLPEPPVVSVYPSPLACFLPPPSLMLDAATASPPTAYVGPIRSSATVDCRMPVLRANNADFQESRCSFFYFSNVECLSIGHPDHINLSVSSSILPIDFERGIDIKGNKGLDIATPRDYMK